LDDDLKKLMVNKALAGNTGVIARIDSRGITPEREAQLKRLGGDVRHRLPFIESVALRVPSRNLAAVASLPWVEHLSSDSVVYKNDEFTVEHSGAGAVYATNGGPTGDGVGVAVLDTGIQHHPDFSEDPQSDDDTRIDAEVSFVPGTKARQDQCGHGTHVAGIIAGNGSASSGPRCYRTFYGIARKARLISVCVLDENGQSDVSTVIQGIAWAVSNRNRYNIRVMNIAFGHPVGESYTTDPLCRAVEKAWRAGIVVVCAAGNSGRLNDTPRSGVDNEGYGTAYGSIQSPANDPQVITVGAMKLSPAGDRASDQIATYSSRGPTRLDLVMKPDIVAPGNGIISTLSKNSDLEDAFGGANVVPLSEYRLTDSDRPSQRYLRLSGTSMAAPVVSGAVALLLERAPNLTPDSVKARLMATADKWTFPNGAGDACTFGAGYLNIPAALGSTLIAKAPALSPTLTPRQDGSISVDGTTLWAMVNGQPSIWGTQQVKGLQAIWGGKSMSPQGNLTPNSVMSTALVWTDSQTFGVSATGVDLSSIAGSGDLP
jgi:serine protease AprX